MALNAQPTQDFVPIKEIRDGILILKDGNIRAVLIASSINLSLKSEEEQQAIIMQFQALLNSLDFSVQIVVQSRRYDIRPYLILLEERERAQQEPLLKIQTREYMEFIKTFADERNIMTKNFFLVIPYSSDGNDSRSALGGFFNNKKSDSSVSKEVADFEEKRSQLEQRIGIVQQGFARIGVRTAQLGTDEAIELFYKVFNPGESDSGIKIKEE